MGYTLILGVFLCIISLRGFYGLKNPKCIITAKKPKYYCRYMKIRPNSMKTLKIQLPMEKNVCLRHWRRLYIVGSNVRWLACKSANREESGSNPFLGMQEFV